MRPAVRLDVTKLAALPVIAIAPLATFPSTENVTVPPGVVEPAVCVTVAVTVTAPYTSDAFGDPLTATVVPCFTTSEYVGDVLVASPESPEYTAVIGCVPSVNVDNVSVAVFVVPIKPCVPPICTPLS